MRYKLLCLIGLITTGTLVAFAFQHGVLTPGKVNSAVIAASETETEIAALGRVEPQSEEIRVGAEISGKIGRLFVREGDRVMRGQLLAVLENSDLQARLTSAEARIRERDAEWRRIVNGAREEERKEAKAAVDEANAVLENVRSEAARRDGLFAQGIISRDEDERFHREVRVAEARHDAARERFAVIDTGAREEDRAKAEAAFALAETEAEEARAALEKSQIRAPITGVILQRYLNEGETISASADMPLLSLGDISHLRVRAEIDESDIAKLRLGQRAYVKAAAFGDRRFWGHVIRIGESLGQKRVRTTRAAEKTDRDILETLIELDETGVLPVGVRVDVYIAKGQP